ncbi:FAD:protein FMN transferase [Pseudarthrobacter sp. N5]|uniref:FAD:protein FMN transferase n=1 Tax=Pseudarthrobacter sp. N5 TaxID=3418416 RepID=UPI003CF8A158
MGTVISLTIPALAREPSSAADGPRPAEDELAAATAVVERLFTELDGRFSLYRSDSEASRLARGELALAHASADMRARYGDAAGWRLLTDGAFTPARPDGVLDLSGLIKGYAVKEAGTSLKALGLNHWCLNAGGDVLVSGSPRPGSDDAWLAGVVDPEDRKTLLAGFPIGGGRTRCSLATSGSAERGDHIWGVGSTTADFRQVSVAAADVVTADVLATAIVAGGLPMLDRATQEWDVDVLAVRRDGGLLATPGFRT